MAHDSLYIPVSAAKTERDYTSTSDGDSESLLSNTEAQRYTPPRHRSRSFIHWIFHGISILVCVGLLVHSNGLDRSTFRGFLDKTHAWSPLLDSIDTPYQDVYWNGSLWYQSPWKGPPTPKVEKAWHDLMQYGLISVSQPELERAGYSPISVKFPPESGGGYLATATGTHHIHCLYYLWQDHHAAYFPDVQVNKKAIPEMYERHYEHCIDYIRQGIMCNYDTTMIAYNWVRDHNSPTPNGNTNHKCVDWTKMQGWLKDRAVEMPEGFVWKQPPDAVSLDYNP